jgi:transcriptional regulator with XRE-family HTH domain
MDEKQIAKNIRKLRLAKGLSLDGLAKLTGLTKGYVSKIENSEKAPPFSTLIKVAGALDIDMNLLIAEDAESPHEMKLCIVRKGEGKVVSAHGTLFGYRYEALAMNKLGKNMEPFLITPAFDEKAVFSHEGEEYMYVLEGVHEFAYGEEKYVLHKGDSIYFDAIVPHRGRSIGKKRAKVLAIMYSYKR